MDSMEQRLRSLVLQGFSVDVSAFLERFGEHKGQVRFRSRMTLRGATYGSAEITVEGNGLTLDEAAAQGLAAAEAYLQSAPRQAAE